MCVILICIIIGLLLIIHGFAPWQTPLHGDLGSLRPPALTGFILAGIAVLITLAVASALISLLTSVHFWDSRMTIRVMGT